MHPPHSALARPHHARRCAVVIAYDFVRKIRIDAAGHTTTYIRNPLGQVTTTQGPDASYAYAYDKTHRLASVTDNRPATARLAAAKTLTYSYSPGGMLNMLTDTEGNRTDYLYDNVGRLTGIWATGNIWNVVDS